MVLEYSRLCFFSYTTLLCSFFFNDTATTEIYTLSLHDALPISTNPVYRRRGGVADLEGAALDPGSEHLVVPGGDRVEDLEDRKSTRLNSSHANISYAVFCLKKKKKHTSNSTSRQPFFNPSLHA